MSSKGRKLQPKNDEEFFATPIWSIETFITSPLIKLPGGVWIEPCAGTGNIVKTINRFRTDIDWRLCELQERFRPDLEAIMRAGRDELTTGDFVNGIGNFANGSIWDEEAPIADVLIMNPPFTLTMAFVEAAFRRARHVVCLQRKGFFGTQGRAEWLRTYCPDDYTLWKRASFRSDGQTDSTEYSWFHWPPDPFDRTGIDARKRRVGQIAMLDKPPAQEQLQQVV